MKAAFYMNGLKLTHLRDAIFSNMVHSYNWILHASRSSYIIEKISQAHEMNVGITKRMRTSVSACGKFWSVPNIYNREKLPSECCTFVILAFCN